VKPRRSGGGQGVRRWRSGDPLPAGHYLQERIEGVPGSVIFAADGRRAVTLGVSRQLVGERHFGAAGFRYCGSLLGVGDVALFGRDAAIRATAAALAQAATEEFGLVGLNGIDFIARAGVPVPIEINPRYTASMELVERASGISMFETHVRACRGVLPRAAFPGRGLAVYGKAIVFARRTVRIASARRWIRDGSVRDVPHPGERIERGRPVCTVLARAASADGCHAALRRRAVTIYRQLAAAAPAAGRTR
jgi:predicted ATP-grasp superfamily ATP-dependent carboligase